MENLRRILNASWRWERWITWILHQSPNNTLAAALIDEVFKSSISHHLLFLSHLSRLPPIMAAEKPCCVCRSDEPWPTEDFRSAGAKMWEKKDCDDAVMTLHSRCHTWYKGITFYQTNVIMCPPRRVKYCLSLVMHHGSDRTPPPAELHIIPPVTLNITQPNTIDYKSWLTILILIKTVH